MAACSGLFLPALAIAAVIGMVAGQLGAPSHLSVEYLECGGPVPGHVGLRPLGIDKPYPRLQWRVSVTNSSMRGIRQLSYQLQVFQYGRTSGLAADQPFWDSGKILGNRNAFIPSKHKDDLDLKPLESDSDYYFQVKWATYYAGQNLESEWSAPANFSTSLFDATEWTAEWITTPTEGSPEKTQMIRGDFEVPSGKSVARSRLYITGLGYYELWRDGAKVDGQRRLGAQTYFPKRALYDTYVFPLNPGANVIALRVGPGFWVHDKNPSLWAIAQLHITATDGTEYVVRSHGSAGCNGTAMFAEHGGARAARSEISSVWHVHDDPCKFSDLYKGELYDAREVIPNWDSPSNLPRTWLTAYSPVSKQCAVVRESDIASVGCSEPDEVITDVKFASFGTSTGGCESCGSGSNTFAVGRCHAANSSAIVLAACVGKVSCQVLVSHDVFGDPCHYARKHLSVSVACGAKERVRRVDATKTKGADKLLVSAPSIPIIGTLSSHPMTHINSPLEPIEPVSVKEVKPRVFVFDFGVNLAGVCIIDYHVAKVGTVISIMKGEELAADGTVHNQLAVNMTTVYITKGGTVNEAWSPSWVYYGFRYAQVTGIETVDQIKLLMSPMSSAIRERGYVEFMLPHTSGKLLNQVQSAIRRTQASNLMSIPTDCPNREKRGWMGDAQVTAPVAMWNYDMPAFYTNWIRTMSDVQDAGHTGVVPDVVPQGVGGTTDATWSSAYPLISYYMYQHYGDRELIEEHYAGYKAYVDYLTSTTDAGTGLLLYHKYGDWCNMYPRTQEIATTGPISACFHYMLDLQLLSGFALIAGNNADATKYLDLHRKLLEPFHTHFYNKSVGGYVDGTQTVNLLPLFGRYVPDDVQSTVETNLIEDIVKTHKMHLTTGAVGTRYILPVLTQLGRPDIAIALANQSSFPSWGNWITKGATSLWENWSGVADETHPPAPTHDHIFLGSHGSWLYEVGLGIKPKLPGFETVIIRPPLAYFKNETIADACRESEGQMLLSLEGAEGSYESLRGSISVTWSQQKPDANHTVFRLSVDLPPSTNASVYLPQRVTCTMTDGVAVFPPAENVTIYEGNNLIWINNYFHWPGSPGITSGGQLGTENAIVFEAGSGYYEFEVREVY